MIQNEDFQHSISDYSLKDDGAYHASSPSNIALVKYWGKYDIQIPANPSISYTLTKCKTDTTLQVNRKQNSSQKIQVFLSGEERPDFIPKIKKFFGFLESYVPFINEYDCIINTENTFPHSSGIASSASGMSALAKCIVAMEQDFGLILSPEKTQERMSFLSRLGSGSACRSIYKGLAVWGKHKEVQNSSDLYAVEYNHAIHDNFKDFKDTILIIEEEKKQVSSSVGHNLMNAHTFANARFQQANTNLLSLLQVLQNGDLLEFGKIVENEALTLHAMMMTSNPAFLLMKPNTVGAIQKVWDYRQETKNPLFFTVDAGANLHLLYPEAFSESIDEFISSELKNYCANGKMIFDESSVQ